MRTLVTAITLLATLSLLVTTAVAEEEMIAPITAVAGQPIDLDYLNITHPAPSRKVMSFDGMAEASGPPGAAILGINFDYVDPITGADVIIPQLNFYMNAVQTGAGLVPIHGGPVQLLFCPEQVSIHFENLTPNTEIVFQGKFTHVCIPVPEPTTLSLLLLCGVASVGRRWRVK